MLYLPLGLFIVLLDSYTFLIVIARSVSDEAIQFFWIASVSALKRCAGLIPGEACKASVAGSLSLAMTDL
jgi:hypothetical protein